MVSTVIDEAIITIAVIVAASIFAAAFMAGFQTYSDAQKRALVKFGDEVETRIEIIFADATGDSQLKVWVKNVGYKSISQPLIGSNSDLFLKKADGTTLRVPYGALTPPTWGYSLLNDGDSDGDWDPHETIEITVFLEAGSLTSGDWLIEFVAPTGSSDEYLLSV